MAVAAAAGLLALGACGPKDADSDTAPASTPPAATVEQPAARPAAPFSFSETKPDAEVKLTLDRRLVRWPALHRQLYDLEVSELRKFAADAKVQRDEMKGQDYQPPPYARELTWSVSGATPRLVSLEQTWYENTGGAHPNHGFGTLLWDTATRKPLDASALFVAGDDAGIDKALCDGLAAAKAKKGAGDWDRQNWPCPKWREAKFVLVPTADGGRFNGLTFLFDPYEVGPYAEGEYEVTLPWTVFRNVLAPAWAAEFGEAPR
jgi:hypothetical protein